LVVGELGCGYTQLLADLLDVAFIVGVAVDYFNVLFPIRINLPGNHWLAGALVYVMVGLDVIRRNHVNFLHGFWLI